MTTYKDELIQASYRKQAEADAIHSVLVNEARQHAQHNAQPVSRRGRWQQRVVRLLARRVWPLEQHPLLAQ